MATSTELSHCEVSSFEARSQSAGIVFIDPRLDAAENLAAGVIPGLEVVLLDPNQDGVQQVSTILAARDNQTSIHLVTHGAPGVLQLGRIQLSLETLSEYAIALQSWARASTTTLLLYGCEVASGWRGQAFVARLSELTNGDRSLGHTHGQ